MTKAVGRIGIEDGEAQGVAPPDFARWISDQARRTYEDEVRSAARPFQTLEAARAFYDSENRGRLKTMRRLFAVDTASTTLDGVSVEVVVPAGNAPVIDGVARTLICLHGGGFAWGAGAGALLEAVPIAAVSRLSVVAVDYRMAPEHRHPAAIDDVVRVYRALLKDRPAASIGFFGCSAGGILVAQVMARLLALGEPVPGAICMMHGTGLELGGDLLAMAPGMTGDEPTVGVASLMALPYFQDADPADPVIFPGEHPEILATFPPALLITSTRDFAGSSVAVMHRRLLAEGAQAELIVFDGMWHAFHMSGDLPESRELYDRVSEFFLRRLR